MALNGDVFTVPTTYEDVSKFTAAMRDRSDYLETEAANAEEAARAARNRASEARRVYETLAKLQESMEPKAVDPMVPISGQYQTSTGEWVRR
jgi:hypothetical protein